jgi:hypothetical protein
VRGQNLFLSETKRIREGKPNLPHKPGGGQNLCCFTQKREDQLSGGFIHHFEPRRIRALKIFCWGEKVSVSRPRKYIDFGLLEKRIHSERAFRNANF